MSSRERAQALILAGKVRLGDEVADKPGRKVSEDTPVTINEAFGSTIPEPNLANYDGTALPIP